MRPSLHLCRLDGSVCSRCSLAGFSSKHTGECGAEACEVFYFELQGIDTE